MQSWIDIIIKYFTHSETEFVVFGDEKQNIYDRELDENNEIIVRQIPGNWNYSLNKQKEFNSSFRMTNDIFIITLNFQRKFLNNKYNLDFDENLPSLIKIQDATQLFFDYQSEKTYEYHKFNQLNSDLLIEIIYQVLNRNKIHSSDVGILSSRVDVLREVDFLIRTKKNELTTTTFETKEEFDQNGNNQDKIEELRKIKKNHFWMKTGTVKLSTVHSFKGWEIDTLFLFIEKEDDENKKFANAELIYTGLTRARRNLIVFNLGNEIYDEFFKEEIKIKFEHK